MSALLFFCADVCLGADWRSEVGGKLNSLAKQLNDGCSSEVKEARKVYQFGKGEDAIYAALISLEGQHCGNANIEYLAVYRTGFTRPKDENDTPPDTYSLAALAIVGGRGERFVDFDSLKYAGEVFTLKAMGYHDDAMCCPSVPLVLRYKLSFYGLIEMQPNTSLERTRER